MIDPDKEDYENILVLADIVEADLMEQLLKDEEIPFYVRPWRDINFDGVFEMQKGFGWLIGRSADKERINTIYTDNFPGLKTD